MALDPVTAVLELGGKLIDRLWPNKEEADKAKLRLLELQMSGQLAELTAETDLAKGQLKVNEVEAANPNVFVSGWRPALGWACVAIFVCNYIGVPMLAWVSPYFAVPPPPRLEMGEVIPVLMGMLGLGSLRTAEKIKGVTK